MPDRHKYAPIRFRPPEADRLWLTEHAQRTGQAVNAVLVAALSEYRIRHEQALARSHMRPAHSPTCKCGTCNPPKNGATR